MTKHISRSQENARDDVRYKSLARMLPQKNAVGLNHTEHTGKIESINSQR